MNTRPILFGTPMVRALLDGTKTQTRRTSGLEYFSQPENQPDRWRCVRVRDGIAFFVFGDCPTEREVKCPYGAPGNLLWVRETFQPIFADGFTHTSNPAPDWETGVGYAPRYMATDGAVEWIDADDNITSRCKPAIHMPRWASRITLRSARVRVERLQEISEADAIAEGWPHAATGGAGAPLRDAYPIGWFANLWEDINGRSSWETNPWVWALRFDVIRTNVEQLVQEAKAS